MVRERGVEDRGAGDKRGSQLQNEQVPPVSAPLGHPDGKMGYRYASGSLSRGPQPAGLNA